MDPNEHDRYMARTRTRIRATLIRTIGRVRNVIRSNRELAATSEDHRASAERRIIEGEQELAVAEEELRRVEAGEPIGNLHPPRDR